MCRIFYIFILLPIFLISQIEKEVPLGSEKAPSYVKNQYDHVIVSGEFSEKLKSRNGKMFLYEMIGNDDYLLDSVNISAGKFSFKKRLFYAGVYRIAFNNSNNSLDFVINPSEINKSQSLFIKLNNFRIKKDYEIPNSKDNDVKKSYAAKEESINSKIKLIRKSQKSRDEKIREMKTLQNELFQYGLLLDSQFPGTYYGMIISNMQSPYNTISHLYFNDIDFSDACIIRSSLLPNRIQTYIQNFNDYSNNKFGFHDAVDVVMEYAKQNDKVAEFCMYNMLDGFYNTGQTQKKNDPIWNDLCDYIMNEYIFGEGCGDDIEPSDLLKERASQFKNLQVGNIPPNIITKDLNGVDINLEYTCSKNNYTVLLFWASHCNHCMAEMPGFANWYSQNSEGVEIIAISLDGQKKKWETTVKDNNFNWVNICQFKVYKSPICLDYKIKKTPSIFVLNNKMEIVAKPKSTHQLRSFLLSN
ncbi:MAG: DUF4369 domain-containing protein [Flavobacteriales bacterium TMED191]|nr:MAG: DUF4369 domain-containing protein [Flavobacteriales bacterium TMED191]